MDKPIKGFMKGFVKGFWIGVAVAVTLCCWLIPSYMEGQIDALNGNVKYHLVKQNDNSTKWERIGDR